MEMIGCPDCGQEVSSKAIACPKCGRRIAGNFSPGLAMVLSFLLPGLGQLYGGKVLRGLVWFCATALGYFCFVVPGLILHLACIYNAKGGN